MSERQSIADHAELRERVRAFLAEHMVGHRPGLGTDGPFSRSFCRALGEAGFLCMTLPKEYGGHERTLLERFVVTEELIAAGAPIMASWAADRQIAQSILTHGSDELKRTFIPRIAAGECYFALGMSEPEAGSDLASVRCRADRVDGGWRLNGQKIWTSYAHEADHILVLCRTDPDAERHSGLSQLIVPTDSPGVDVRPVPLLNGDHHFNEVFFDDVFVPDSMVLGEIGQGWSQVTAELGHERAGADRYLTTFSVLRAWLDGTSVVEREQIDEESAAGLGELMSQLAAIRSLSWATIESAERNGAISTADAALVKEMGTAFEQHSVALLRRLTDHEVTRDADSLFEDLLADAILKIPMVTIRGGTNEILRGVAARALDVQAAHPADESGLGRVIEAVVADRAAAAGRHAGRAWDPELWAALDAVGATRVAVPESLGGGGGSLADAAEAARAAGRTAAFTPLVETILAGHLASAAGLALGEGPTTLAPVSGQASFTLERRADHWRLVGTARHIPFATHAAQMVVVIGVEGDEHVAVLPEGQWDVRARRNLADEPRDDVTVDLELPLSGPGAPAPLPGAHAKARRVGAFLRAHQIAGALQVVAADTIDHARARTQFGRPLAAFQAVQAHLVTLAGRARLAEATALAMERRGIKGVDLDHIQVALLTAAARECVRTAVPLAYQVHGAVGLTLEHDLNLHTRRLLAWADEFGTERDWQVDVGRAVSVLDANGAWDIVTGVDHG